MFQLPSKISHAFNYVHSLNGYWVTSYIIAVVRNDDSSLILILCSLDFFPLLLTFWFFFLLPQLMQSHHSSHITVLTSMTQKLWNWSVKLNRIFSSLKTHFGQNKHKVYIIQLWPSILANLLDKSFCWDQQGSSKNKKNKILEKCSRCREINIYNVSG